MTKDEFQEEQIKLSEMGNKLNHKCELGHVAYQFDENVAKKVGADAAILLNLITLCTRYGTLYLIGSDDKIHNQWVFIPSEVKIQKKINHLNTRIVKRLFIKLIEANYLTELEENGVIWYYVSKNTLKNK